MIVKVFLLLFIMSNEQDSTEIIITPDGVNGFASKEACVQMAKFIENDLPSDIKIYYKRYECVELKDNNVRN